MPWLEMKHARARAGKSQWDLSQELGLHPNIISRWERRAVVPSVKSLVRLCQALDVSADYLLGLSEDP